MTPGPAGYFGLIASLFSWRSPVAWVAAAAFLGVYGYFELDKRGRTDLYEQIERPRIHIRDPRLVPDPPLDILLRFVVDSDGYIIEGPRARPDEPIDYTDLMTNKTILENFFRVAFGGGEIRSELFGQQEDPFLRDIENRIVKHKGALVFRILSSPGDVDPGFVSSFDHALDIIDESTGIEIALEPEDDDVIANNLIVLLGDDDHVQQVSQEFAAAAQEFPDDPVRSKSMKDLSVIIRTLRDLFGSACATVPSYHEDRSRGATVLLFYLDQKPSNLSACAYEELVQSMGLLRDDDAVFNSMFTDTYKLYSVPTKSDVLLLRVLYDARIKHGMSKSEAAPVVREILAALRPHGEAVPE